MRSIQTDQRTVLSREDHRRFAAALNAPAKPSKALRAAVTRNKRLIRTAD
jgi:uncharacterized protein (DUF1778 family)